MRATRSKVRTVPGDGASATLGRDDLFCLDGAPLNWRWSVILERGERARGSLAGEGAAEGAARGRTRRAVCKMRRGA